MNKSFSLLLVSCLAIAGCGGSSDKGNDAGADASADAGTDASADAATDAAVMCDMSVVGDAGITPVEDGMNLCADDGAALIAYGGDTVALSTECGLTCFGEEVCTAECFQAATCVSDGCASCFGQIVECSTNRCSAECVAMNGERTCDECLEEELCNEEFTECSGLPTDGACRGDLGLLTLPTIEPVEISTACGTECFTVEGDYQSCVSSCFVRDTGVSMGCGDCFGGIVDCITDNCINECVLFIDEVECAACRSDEEHPCDANFTECSGVPAG